MEQRARFVVVVFAAMSMLVSACHDDSGVAADPPRAAAAPAGAAAETPGAQAFCEPIREAFQALFEVESSENEAFTSAARTAAQNLREAEKSAPPELAAAIAGVADYYEKTTENGQPLGLSAFQEVRPHVGKLGEAVQDQCGFTIDGAPR